MFTLRSLNDLDATDGTVKLLDASHRLKSKENTDIILIPQPKDDPNDPLNWPRWKKLMAFATACLFAIEAGWTFGGLGSAIILLIKEFHKPLKTTVDGVINWEILLLGLGVFAWVPIILRFGTRPALLSGAIILFITMIWAALSHSFHSLEAACMVAAFTLCLAEVMPSIIVKDIFFLHERGWWMGIAVYMCQTMPSGAAVASSFLITAAGWRWHFWLIATYTGINILLIFFFFPETQYFRDEPLQLSPDISENPSNGKEAPVIDIDERASPIPAKKSFLQQLKPWSGINPGIEKNTSFLYLFIRPWPLAFYPAVIYSFLVFACGVACVVNILNTSAAVFQAPPYNMTPGISGLIHLGAVIGGAFGAYCGGGLTDIIIQWKARRNDGVFEPEDRLLTLFLPLFILPAGELMYGLGVARVTSWPLPFIGAGLVWFGLASLPSITIAYVVDCYYPVAPDLFLLIIGLKNVFGFGFAYAILPWIKAWGYGGAFGTTSGICFFIILLGWPLYIWGKKFRHATAKWKVILS